MENSISQLDIIEDVTELSAPPIKKTLSDFEQYRITDLTDIPFPTPVVTISGETISTAENITVLSGESKSGKSAFGSMIIAGSLSTDAHSLEQLEVLANSSFKAIVHIDTEQARHRHQGNIRSILKRAGLKHCPDYYLSYNIRKLDLTEYEEVTSGICEAASTVFGGVFLIFIDGMADYIASVNDEEQAKKIVKYFEGLSITYQCPVITVVHTNPGGTKERGHLGSELQRKAESVIMVVSEDDCSYIQPKYLRNAGKANVPQIQFRYDDEFGYHTDYGVKDSFKSSGVDKKRVLLENASKAIFSERQGGAVTYGTLIKEIMKKTNKSERTAKNYKTEMEANDLISQLPDGMYVEFINSEIKDPF